MSVTTDNRFPFFDYWSSHLFSLEIRYRVGAGSMQSITTDVERVEGYGLGDTFGTGDTVPPLGPQSSLYLRLLTKVVEELEDAGVAVNGGFLSPNYYFTDGTLRTRWLIDRVPGDLTALELVCRVSGPDRRAYEIDWQWLGFDPRWSGLTASVPVGGAASSPVLTFVLDGTDVLSTSTVLPPLGVWQPRPFRWAVAPDRESNVLASSNEFANRFSGRRYVGDVSRLTTELDLVPAANIWRSRSIDLASPGWAQQAGRYGPHVRSNTLDVALYWMARSSAAFPVGINLGFVRPDFPELVGYPLSLAEYQLTTAGRHNPDTYNRLRWACLDGVPSLEDVVTAQSGRQKHRVELGFIDVTPGVPYGTFEAGDSTGSARDVGWIGLPASVGRSQPRDGRFG